MPWQDALDSNLDGLLHLNLTLGGTFTAIMEVGRRTVRLSGVLTPSDELNVYGDPMFKARVPIPALPDTPQRYLNLTVSPVSDYIDMVGFVDSPQESPSQSRNFFLLPVLIARGGVDFDPAGRYVFFVGSNEPVENRSVSGFGFGAVQVSPSLYATAAGVLADGTAFTAARKLYDGGRPVLPVRIRMNGNRDALAGLITLPMAQMSDSVTSADLQWVKRAQPLARIAPEGFSMQTIAWCGRYQAPRPGTVLFPETADRPGNAHVELAGGGLDEAAQGADLALVRFHLHATPLAYANSGRFQIPARKKSTTFPLPNATGLSLEIFPATGLFTGSFNLTDSKPGNPTQTITRRATIAGVLLRHDQIGMGFFLLPQLPDPSAVPPTTLGTPPIRSGAIKVERSGDY
ncbi:MAG: hypothetical protein U0984_13480 [Prosthecobacter sp.]|nr:hypothetical protein [Prosthecobacter sp.]